MALGDVVCAVANGDSTVRLTPIADIRFPLVLKVFQHVGEAVVLTDHVKPAKLATFRACSAN